MRFPLPSQTNGDLGENRPVDEIGSQFDHPKALPWAKLRHSSHHASKSADLFDLWTIWKS
jgi:hypothetical protein